FVLPSLSEPWALVIHEAVSAGLPVICTKVCGASPHFVIDGHNGYKVEMGSVNDLKNAMEAVIGMDISGLLRYSENSRLLSNSITPKLTAASLMQLINRG